MSNLIEELAEFVQQQLTPAERASGVAYLSTIAVPAGTKLQVLSVPVEVQWAAYRAFVDREPSANWGHSCRHIFINLMTRETLSIEERFPPIHRGEEDHWRIAYRAPGVSDKFLLVPE